MDVVAVGIYGGMRPGGDALALERAFGGLPDGEASNSLLTQYIDYGVISGDLATPFFLPDPRATSPPPRRLIAVVGLGEPGLLGVPEVTVLVRSLCWSLGRMGFRHLAAPLLGTESGTLPVRDAVSAWIRGIGDAVQALSRTGSARLERVTFCEPDRRKLDRIATTLRTEQGTISSLDRPSFHTSSRRRSRPRWHRRPRPRPTGRRHPFI